MSCLLYTSNNGPWGDLKVDVVLECSGFYTSKEKAQAHINAGARKVVISAPAGNDLPTIVYNTNHETLKASDTIISAASCTTNCLAPVSYTHLETHITHKPAFVICVIAQIRFHIMCQPGTGKRI